MNRFLKLSVIALGLAALPAFSQANPATLNTSITIVTPITFTVGNTLNFGAVAASSIVGNNNIHVNAQSATRTISGGGNGVLEPGAPPVAVGTSSMVSGIYSLNIKASALTTAGAGLTLSDVTLSHDGGAEASLLAAGVTFTPVASPTALSFGGTMNVTNAAGPGTFAGTFLVTGTYQ